MNKKTKKLLIYLKQILIEQGNPWGIFIEFEKSKSLINIIELQVNSTMKL